MTTVLLVRHGQSRANLYHIFAGHSHFPLSELGKVQTQLTAKYIAQNYKVDKIYSSDLLRAFDTACSISEELGFMPIITHPDLREINAGDWEGARNGELEAISPENFAKWKDDVANCACPNGETVAHMAERFYNKVLELATKNDGKTIVIATHATPVRAMTTLVKHGTLEKMNDVAWSTNASVTELCFENGTFTLKEESHDAHLADLSTSLWKM